MIVLRTPKGWTGPEDGRRHAGRGDVPRAPGAARRARAEPRAPRAARGVDEELPARGALRRRAAGCAPSSPRSRRAGDAAHEREPARQRRPAPQDLRLPDFRDYAVDVPAPGRRRRPRRRACRASSSATCCELNRERAQLPRLQPRRDGVEPLERRLRGDEPRVGRPRSLPGDDHVAPDGRVMEMLSEHQCQGWLEGYLLTGRHGFFSCYEAFIHIVDSMFNQHAKWLKVTRDDPLAAADRVAQLPAHVARLAAGPQRLQPPGSRASSITSSTRRPTSSASTCRPTRTRCSR